jgi:hypothetical protein
MNVCYGTGSVSAKVHFVRVAIAENLFNSTIVFTKYRNKKCLWIGTNIHIANRIVKERIDYELLIHIVGEWLVVNS